MFKRDVRTLFVNFTQVDAQNQQHLLAALDSPIMRLKHAHLTFVYPIPSYLYCHHLTINLISSVMRSRTLYLDLLLLFPVSTANKRSLSAHYQNVYCEKLHSMLEQDSRVSPSTSLFHVAKQSTRLPQPKSSSSCCSSSSLCWLD